ncbi:MAG: glycosyltransferase, partial [Psychrobacter alimentarius]
MKQHKKIVVLVINCLQGGGAERVVLTLGQGFYELGYEVHILRFKPLVEYDLGPNLNYHVLRFK